MNTQLSTEIAAIQHADIRELVLETLAACPTCFWTMPAATTGKYHPAASLGEGGLIRHTKAVVRITRHLLDMQGTPPHEREYSCAIAAAILHDCCKKYDHETHTAFSHPRRAAELIEQQAIALSASGEAAAAARTIAAAVASHMGRWNTNHRTGEQLPTPLTPLQKLVHTADFLASRKDITLADIS